MRIITRMEDIRVAVRDFILECVEKVEGVRNPTQLARRAGVAPSTINRFMASPETASIPRTDTLAKIAKAAGLQVPVAVRNQPRDQRVNELETINVLGVVQAGEWIEALRRPMDDWLPITLPKSTRYPHIQRFGLTVAGPSMNREMADGTIAVCISLDDLGRDPEPGEFVVVQRHRGPLIEVTVKEYVIEEDGTAWLWPRSTDPRYQQPWRVPQPDDDMDESEQIEVIAVVDAAYREMRRR